MIDEEWVKPPMPLAAGIAVQVAAVVPLPAELGGAGEVLGLYAFGNLKLPSGDARSGEGIFAAAARVVLGMAGISVTPERLIYVVEQVGKQLTLCVLCALRDPEDTPDRAGVRFVPPAAADELDPAAVRELLIEDVQQGFVRPVAFASVGYDELGRVKTTVSW